MTPELYHILLKNVILFSRPVEMALPIVASSEEQNEKMKEYKTRLEKYDERDPWQRYQKMGRS